MKKIHAPKCISAIHDGQSKIMDLAQHLSLHWFWFHAVMHVQSFRKVWAFQVRMTLSIEGHLSHALSRNDIHRSSPVLIRKNSPGERRAPHCANTSHPWLLSCSNGGRPSFQIPVKSKKKKTHCSSELCTVIKCSSIPLRESPLTYHVTVPARNIEPSHKLKLMANSHINEGSEETATNDGS